MEGRTRETSTAAAASLIVVLLIFASMVSIQRHVRERLRTIDPSTDVEFDSIAPSATHGFYVVFKIHGTSEYSRAYWRLFPRPYSRVDFEM
jgi:hypothetical protein